MLCCLSVIYMGPTVKVHTQEYSCVIEHHFCAKSVKAFLVHSGDHPGMFF